jgi:hypothetical protein
MIARALTAIRAAWCYAVHDSWAYAGGSHRECRECQRKVRVPHHIEVWR